MAYSLPIGIRYLRGATRGSVKTVSGIAVVGVALGVAALLVVLSITTGFQREFRDKVLGVNAHVLVMKYGVDFDEYEDVIERALAIEGVAGAGPFLIQPMMLVHEDRTASVLVKGVDPARVGDVLALPQQMIAGTLEGLRLEGSVPPPATAFRGTRASDDWAWLDELADGSDEAATPGSEDDAAPEDQADEAPAADGADAGVAPDAGAGARAALVDAGADASDPLAGIDLERMREYIVRGGGPLFEEDGQPVRSIRRGEQGPVVLREAAAPAREDLLSPADLEALLGAGEGEAGLPDDSAEDRLLSGGGDPSAPSVPAGPVAGMVLGKTLAQSLGLHVGDRVRLVSPLTGLGVAAANTNRTAVSREYQILGIFEAGFQEYDSQLCYVDLYEAQHFYGQGDSVTGVELRLRDIDRSGDVAARLERELGGPFHTLDWRELNRNLFTALEIQKVVLSIVFSLITIVASFMVIVTLIMTVLEKKREIAILKAMGATDLGILTIFMVQGLLVGLVGTLIGLALGGGIVLYLQANPIVLDPKVYLIDQLPVVVRPIEFVVTALTSLLICGTATLLPSLSAARMIPVDGLRYE